MAPFVVIKHFGMIRIHLLAMRLTGETTVYETGS